MRIFNQESYFTIKEIEEFSDKKILLFERLKCKYSILTQTNIGDIALCKVGQSIFEGIITSVSFRGCNVCVNKQTVFVKWFNIKYIEKVIK